jgi:hypothetical protein
MQFFASSRKSAALRGGVLLYAAQAVPPIDAEIAEKGRLWTETIYTAAFTGLSAAISLRARL